MVRMRLRRMGTRQKPYYRIVVADQRSPRDGRFIETVGSYDPRTEPPTVHLEEEKCQEWLRKGAQPTEIVHAILNRHGVFNPDYAAVAAERAAKAEAKRAEEEAAKAEAAAKAEEAARAEEAAKKQAEDEAAAAAAEASASEAEAPEAGPEEAAAEE